MEPFLRNTANASKFGKTCPRNRRRIAALAKQSPEMAFTSLAYLMDIDWLKSGYHAMVLRLIKQVPFMDVL